MQRNIVNFPAITQHCGDCVWSECCANPLSTFVTNRECRRSSPYRRNEPLFRQGDTAENVYFLRSGSAKTIVGIARGYEQIIGFHFPGELIGIDSVANGYYQNTTITLESSGVCRIATDQLTNTRGDTETLAKQVLGAAAEQIVEHQSHVSLLGQKSVHARFATFLLYLADKYRVNLDAQEEFTMSMSRQDIANYLAMAVETLSRVVGDFQRAGLIEIDRRRVCLINTLELKSLAGDNPEHGVPSSGTNR